MEERSRIKNEKTVVCKRSWNEMQPHTQLERVWKFSQDLLENIHCFYEKIWFISKSLGKISGFKRIPIK